MIKDCLKMACLTSFDRKKPDLIGDKPELKAKLKKSDELLGKVRSLNRDLEQHIAKDCEGNRKIHKNGIVLRKEEAFVDFLLNNGRKLKS